MRKDQVNKLKQLLLLSLLHVWVSCFCCLFFFLIISIAENAARAYFAVVKCILGWNVRVRESKSVCSCKVGCRQWWPTLFTSGCIELRQKEKTDVALQHHQWKPQLMEVHLSMWYFLLILFFPVTGEAQMEQSSAGLRFTFIAVGGLVMLSTRRSMNDHRVRARLRFLWCCVHQLLSVYCVACVSCL